MRQIFSIWFWPMYHAHVRLITVLDLVANDDPDYHDPLDRILKLEDAEGESGEKTTTAGVGAATHHHAGTKRTWKISKQEDLYQVNEFLKFTGIPFLPFLWFLFQLGASAVCVFMSLFLRLSPWALFQKEPARGGVEATIERVESYHDDNDDGETKVDDGGGSTSGEGSRGGGGNASTNGSNRRGSTSSKASPSSTPKKSWKNGNSGKKGGH